MTRPYIKLDPGLPDRKDYYSDGAFRALVTLFCTASFQPKPGVFVSERIAKAMLGPVARHLPFLIEQRDVERLPDGSLRVTGWDEWQEGKYPSVQARMDAIARRRGPLSPAERAFLYRQRRAGTVSDGASDASVTVHDTSRDGDRDTSRDDVTPVSSDRTRPDSTKRLPPAVTPVKRNGSIEPSKDERAEAIARAQARLDDPAATEDVKVAARFALGQLGVVA